MAASMMLDMAIIEYKIIGLESIRDRPSLTQA